MHPPLSSLQSNTSASSQGYQSLHSRQSSLANSKSRSSGLVSLDTRTQSLVARSKGDGFSSSGSASRSGSRSESTIVPLDSSRSYSRSSRRGNDALSRSSSSFYESSINPPMSETAIKDQFIRDQTAAQAKFIKEQTEAQAKFISEQTETQAKFIREQTETQAKFIKEQLALRDAHIASQTQTGK